MNKEEKKYLSDFEKKFPVPDMYSKISSQIEFTKQSSLFMNKKVLFGCLAGGLVAACAITVCVLVIPQNNATPKALVNVELGEKQTTTKSLVRLEKDQNTSGNPNIELVVDSNNKVVSVRGVNDDGKMIISGEAIVGKSLDDALEIIVKVENETGYLLKGEVSVKNYSINISISSDEEAVKELQDKVTTYVKDACDKYGITTTIKNIESYARSELERIVMEQDPTLTQEEVSKMSYEQLLKLVAAYQLERTDIYSEQLEYYYNQAKESKINLSENKYVRDAIDTTNTLYKAILSLYDQAFESLSNAYTNLDTAVYNYLVSEDSAYAKASKAVSEYKDQVLANRKKVNDLQAKLDELKEQGEEYKVIEAQIKVANEALDTADKLLDSSQATLDSAHQAALSFIETARKTIQTCLASLQEIRNKLPDDLTKQIEEKVADTEKKLNEDKDKFFSDFESKHGEEIKKAREEIQNRKKALIEELRKEA